MLVKIILAMAACLLFVFAATGPRFFSSRKDSDESTYWAVIIITSLFWLCVLGLSHI